MDLGMNRETVFSETAAFLGRRPVVSQHQAKQMSWVYVSRPETTLSGSVQRRDILDTDGVAAWPSGFEKFSEDHLLDGPPEQ